MALKPCITCGVPSAGSRCPEHTLRNGSTRSWRTVRETILDRDGHRCQMCGEPANEVDHIRPVSEGGGDYPANLRACCGPCNLARLAR